MQDTHTQALENASKSIEKSIEKAQAFISRFIETNEVVRQHHGTGLFGPDVVGIVTDEPSKEEANLREHLELERAARKKLEAKVEELTRDLTKSREMNAEYVVQLTKVAADNAKWRKIEPRTISVKLDTTDCLAMINKINQQLDRF